MKRRAPERNDRLAEAPEAEPKSAPAPRHEEPVGPMRVAGFVEGSGVREVARIAGVLEVAAWTRGLLRRDAARRR